MRCEQTLAGCEQSVKKSKSCKGRVHFSFKVREHGTIKKESNFKFSVQILKVKQAYNKERSCTVKKERSQEYIVLNIGGYMMKFSNLG